MYKPKQAQDKRKNDVQQCKTMIRDFLCDPMYSVQLPLKKHVKKDVPTYILREPIRALCKKISELNGVAISTIAFLKMKPENVKPMRFAKWNQCLCEVCENMNLKL